MTGRFRSGSPPKNVSAKLFGPDRVHPRFGPPGDTLGRVHRHLGRGLVVFAVVALDAVVAGEVALERREDGHAQLILSRPKVVEEVLDVAPIGFAALDDEAVLGERAESFALVTVGIEREAAAADAVEEVRDLARHDQLRVREGVHQEHLVAIREGDTNIENRGLHGVFSW